MHVCLFTCSNDEQKHQHTHTQLRWYGENIRFLFGMDKSRGRIYENALFHWHFGSHKYQKFSNHSKLKKSHWKYDRNRNNELFLVRNAWIFLASSSRNKFWYFLTIRQYFHTTKTIPQYSICWSTDVAGRHCMEHQFDIHSNVFKLFHCVIGCFALQSSNNCITIKFSRVINAEFEN